jgi:7,8-dihydropterin-6-yl-methyl-4-(beta-D-ribofuranosyl)aminobenzene 5'-phosphate synthase
MRITSLLENTTERDDMQIEHGLSLYIETENRKILFDVGQTDMFRKNAEQLGIDLSEVDLAVISHGHYDHGGGLKSFLEINSHAPIYIRKNAFLPYYNGDKYIGLDPALKDEPRLVFTEDEYKIDSDLTLFSCNERARKRAPIPSALTEKVGECLIPDQFLHEQYLLIEENGIRTLISGCSHKGIMDITEWFMPHVLIGGFHFSKMPLGAELVAAAIRLDSYDTEYYTCHCTGVEQYKFMKRYMKRLNYFSAGRTIYV